MVVSKEWGLSAESVTGGSDGKDKIMTCLLMCMYLCRYMAVAQ